MSAPRRTPEERRAIWLALRGLTTLQHLSPMTFRELVAHLAARLRIAAEQTTDLAARTESARLASEIERLEWVPFTATNHNHKEA